MPKNVSHEDATVFIVVVVSRSVLCAPFRREAKSDAVDLALVRGSKDHFEVAHIGYPLSCALSKRKRDTERAESAVRGSVRAGERENGEKGKDRGRKRGRMGRERVKSGEKGKEPAEKWREKGFSVRPDESVRLCKNDVCKCVYARAYVAGWRMIGS